MSQIYAKPISTVIYRISAKISAWEIINLGFSADRLVRHYFPYKVSFRHSPLSIRRMNWLINQLRNWLINQLRNWKKLTKTKQINCTALKTWIFLLCRRNLPCFKMGVYTQKAPFSNGFGIAQPLKWDSSLHSTGFCLVGYLVNCLFL